MNNDFFFSGNQLYIQDLYIRFQEDPKRIDPAWRTFFEKGGFANDCPSDHFLSRLPHARKNSTTSIVNQDISLPLTYTVSRDTETYFKENNITRNNITRSNNTPDRRIDSLQDAYRTYGHLKACLDPLLLEKRPGHEALDPLYHGFQTNEELIFKPIVAQYDSFYCRSIGVEFMHLPDFKERLWFINQLESPYSFSLGKREEILQNLLKAVCFEEYFDKKHRGIKRFGLDGGESLIVILEQILSSANQLGLDTAAIGMPHRGRLNVLANVLNKPYHQIFAEFEREIPLDVPFEVSGDVKYHLGYSTERKYDDRSLSIVMLDNPSHLEAVNTVVLGYIRAFLDQKNRSSSSKSDGMSILIHGDAACIGQGIVAETILLAYLQGYQVGGTIHVIENNQIGFTTFAKDSRSSLYCSDLGKSINAPILHVNGYDPEACARVADIAAQYRYTFHKDIIIDMWCWRKFGHNEGDEPLFTQPVMYQKIKKQNVVSEAYGKALEASGDFPSGTLQRFKHAITETLDREYTRSKEIPANITIRTPPQWKGLSFATSQDIICDVLTGVEEDILQKIGDVIFHVPDNFALNKKIAKQFHSKLIALKEGARIDWATAELLAFGSLLVEGYSVRLSGEDSQRGTFSQRHAVVFDQNNNDPYVPLNALPNKKGEFHVWNSPLSEYGVLGFEYGYAISNPNALVIWEAQYGDFANGAQIIIDQFLSSGEQKWCQMCGLVLLLPHGMEGQGPEHSSARLERYLQLSANNNWQVCNITTPSNFFHALRRQLTRSFRKPLVVMSPKSLFRNHLCVSLISDMKVGTSFRPILSDDNPDLNPKDIERVVLCSGKIYYELFQEREKNNMKNVYLLRIEQLYPFPQDAIETILKLFHGANIIWCQEESKNNGAWFFVRDCFLKRGIWSIEYAGRPESSSPAVGHITRHIQEQKDLIERALGITQ